MHRYPFTLVCVGLYDEWGRPIHRQPLWLLVIGQRRRELALLDTYEAYSHRPNLEHFFRFAKQKLLLDRFQTAEVQWEERWWHLIHLAYAQLWLARPLVGDLPRPWERYLPNRQQRAISPTMAQRDFGRIVRRLGTPARPPKPRGYSPGRAKGKRFRRRQRYRVLVAA